MELPSQDACASRAEARSPTVVDVEDLEEVVVVVAEPGDIGEEHGRPRRTQLVPLEARPPPMPDQGLDYPKHFIAFVVIVGSVTCMWAFMFAFSMLHGSPGDGPEECIPHTAFGALPSHSPVMMCAYLAAFVASRGALFVPYLAEAIAEDYGGTGASLLRVFSARVIFDLPAYNFVVGVWIFFVHAVLSPPPQYCGDEDRGAHQTMTSWALLAIIISPLWLAVVFWHNALLIRYARAAASWASEEAMVERQVVVLEEHAFDEDLFGEEEGKPYPSSCAICLGTWHSTDLISVTSCRHAFHRECLGNWLRKARTCAMCRRDLTSAPLADSACDSAQPCGPSPSSSSCPPESELQPEGVVPLALDKE